MSAFLFILIALGALAIVATLRNLSLDGLRPRPADLELLQRLRDREERTARIETGGPSVLPDADVCTQPRSEAVARGRRTAGERVIGVRPRIPSVAPRH